MVDFPGAVDDNFSSGPQDSDHHISVGISAFDAASAMSVDFSGGFESGLDGSVSHDTSTGSENSDGSFADFSSATIASEPLENIDSVALSPEQQYYGSLLSSVPVEMHPSPGLDHEQCVSDAANTSLQAALTAGAAGLYGELLGGAFSFAVTAHITLAFELAKCESEKH